jgi:hypothetical protein
MLSWNGFRTCRVGSLLDRPALMTLMRLQLILSVKSIHFGT